MNLKKKHGLTVPERLSILEKFMREMKKDEIQKEGNDSESFPQGEHEEGLGPSTERKVP